MVGSEGYQEGGDQDGSGPSFVGSYEEQGRTMDVVAASACGD
jgi:hypothetical protein